MRRRIGNNRDGGSENDDAPSKNEESSNSNNVQQQQRQQQKPIVPLSMQIMRPFWQFAHCPDCSRPVSNHGSFNEQDFFAGTSGYNSSFNCSRNISMTSMSGIGGEEDGDIMNNKMIPTTPVTMMSTLNNNDEGGVVSIEQLLHDYTTACNVFGCSSRLNPGVLTTFRFSLPSLRVSGNFFDADMLALAEVLLKHCNGALKHIRRLDFTIAAKEGDKSHAKGGKHRGIRSHGAYALSKVLSMSKYIEEVYITGNKIGPYGSSAIFTAAAHNAREDGRLHTLLMRGCRSVIMQ